MSEQEIQRVLAVSGFRRAFLPFKYLGIPICSKKLSTGECNILIERMTKRIQVWSSRNLSYMARVTLVNSVLLAIHSYWAQVSVLPKRILQEVEKICRSFIWKGVYSFDGSGPVAWGRMCVDKQFDGLGIRNIHIWNKAAMGKYVWAIATKKDILFVKWIHNVYIKESQWWDYEATWDSSWYWKKLVAVKNNFKAKIDHASFVSNNYSIHKGYEMLQEQNSEQKVRWDKLVWERMNIPKHRFILWMAMLGKLRTREILWKIGMVTDRSCLLCGQENEEIEHLFFDCRYSTSCLTEIKQAFDWKCSATKLHSICKWLLKTKQSQVKKRVFSVVLSAVIYNIWKARNEALWEQKVMLVNITVKRIIKEIQSRLIITVPKKIGMKDLDWFDKICTK